MSCVSTSRGTEDWLINEVSDHSDPRPAGNAIVNTGAVIAVLLGIPSFFIGLFGAVGVVTGGKLIAGTLGAAWSYLAVAGAYELNRRKFEWVRGSEYRDQHLLAGTVAVSIGLVISGAMHQTMPALAIVPALSATIQANDGHDTKYLSMIHASVLAAGLGVAIWFYTDGFIGKVLLERFELLP